MLINDKNCSLFTELTVMHQKSQKGALPTITSTKCQHDAE